MTIGGFIIMLAGIALLGAVMFSPLFLCLAVVVLIGAMTVGPKDESDEFQQDSVSSYLDAALANARVAQDSVTLLQIEFDRLSRLPQTQWTEDDVRSWRYVAENLWVQRSL